MSIDYRLDGPSEAPLLVLSNSLGTTFELWQPQMAALAQQYRVLRYNQRGHGATPLPEAPLTLEILGQDVIALLDKLDVERAYFCGISMGGLTGLWLNRYHPQRFHKLAVANTAARIGNEAGWQQRAQQVRQEGLAPIAATSPARWFTEDFQRDQQPLVTALTEQLARGDAAGYAACCEALAQADLRDAVPYMSAPMLVIAGEHDPVTTVADAQWLAANAPNVTLAVLPTSHISNVACPELFNQQVMQFFAV
ncbi:3-oxoadipate enol-lactonase [Chania multitudinisentens RB-25]|uniref:3-oxoadipate enol-lactonase n=1 Tax=Chania multitudinisentens RB-25 TaxID=1441930 RepID=W0L8Z5_9GAMM|nr:3-oxoadipate enol-lactonase [Chania multitudinisentens]AHG18440.1 3-oxoadipate enol-lactonase [Chania multitudinisentens RB-25]